ncbi:MAG: monovalent cation/H+ antiporter complex subunit F, partial [Lysobacteraceae bacterium]
LPLYFWLPRTYASASAPAAILFAIMTKLGVYAVVRVYVLVFGAAAFTGALQAGLVWAGAGTTLLAALGALAATQLRGLLGYLVVGSAGVLFMALGLGSLPALAAALYYLAHSTLAMAAFFLLADRVLALDTMYVNALALLIVVGIALGDAVYFEAALLIAVFGFFGTVAAARFLKRGSIVE